MAKLLVTLLRPSNGNWCSNAEELQVQIDWGALGMSPISVSCVLDNKHIIHTPLRLLSSELCFALLYFGNLNIVVEI